MPYSLLNIFAFITVVSGVSVITLVNPVHSVLFLVFVFLGASGMLFTLQLEFIPLTFIVVYVGAIAILFLFVVMMLDIKVTSKTSDFFKYIPIGGLIGSFFIVGIMQAFKLSLISPQPGLFTGPVLSWGVAVDKINNIESLGQLLYSFYFIYFLLAGFILLVAMVGAIILTLKLSKNLKTNQQVFKQLSRNSDIAIFLIRH
jgi:NADH-quinone oxidoreductase subunit J